MPDAIGSIMAAMSADSIIMFCWLIGLVLFLIIEIATLGLTTIWFAGGALVAFAAALLGLPLPIQIVLFFLVSFALLFFVRPVVQEKLNASREKTNVNSIVGREGKVLEPVDNFNGTGRILVGGMEWMARAADEGDIIPVDSRVVIQEVRGVKAIVARKAAE